MSDLSSNNRLTSVPRNVKISPNTTLPPSLDLLCRSPEEKRIELRIDPPHEVSARNRIVLCTESLAPRRLSRDVCCGDHSPMPNRVAGASSLATRSTAFGCLDRLAVASCRPAVDAAGGFAIAAP
jgi:hypothetical protein